MIAHDIPSIFDIAESIHICRKWFKANPNRTTVQVGLFFTTETGGKLVFNVRATRIKEDVTAAAHDPNRALCKSPMAVQAQACYNKPHRQRPGPLRKNGQH